MLILLEGDVATHHVEEEDSQGPDGQGLGFVTVAANPLWRGVDSSAVKVCVVILLEKCTGSKVYELELAGVEVHNEILILDISVNDSQAVARQHSIHNLTEEVPCQFLVKNSLFCDEIKKIFRVGWALENVDKAVTSLVEINF